MDAYDEKLSPAQESSGTTPAGMTARGTEPADSAPGAPRTRVGPAGPPPVADHHGRHAAARTAMSALSPRYRVGAALAVAVVVAVASVHLGMLFLHVAPPNTVSNRHGRVIADWIYPEFENDWKLFAPNLPQQNTGVQVRADIRAPGANSRWTGWYDLSAEDGRAIDGSPLPSHTRQNELRRAWDYYVVSHDSYNRPLSPRGVLAEQYLRRIVVLRLGREHAAGSGGVIERVQIRSRTTNIPAPPWSDVRVPDTSTYWLLPWWPVPPAEAEGGVR